MTSPLLLIISLLTGTLYAWLLYAKKSPWNQQTNLFFALIRVILISALVFLILSPFIRQKITHAENPVIVFAIDNSKSIILRESIQNIRSQIGNLKNIIEKLKKEDITVQLVLPEKSITEDSLQNIKFDADKTDLNGFLNDIQNNNENANIHAVVLLTDGIINAGSSPLYSQFQFDIYTIGLGDTVPRKDIVIKNVQYNNIVSAGNKFPIVAEVKNTGFKNQTTVIKITNSKGLVQEKKIYFKSDEEVSIVDFMAFEDTPGLQHYIIQINPLKDESSTKNNISHIYFNVIEARQKILIAGAVPHPDIKALKAVADKDANIEISVHVPGINELKEEKFDLVIFHQIPNIYRLGADLLNKYSKNNVPMLFISGNLSNINEQNIMTQGLRIMAIAGQQDKVTPEYNFSFSRFTVDTDKMKAFTNAPPVSVPFGEYNLSADWEIVFYQKVGSYATVKPLLAFNLTNKPALGIISGEGIWQWRINEFESTGETIAFDDFFNKLFSLLAKKEDKSKLRVTPAEKEFTDNEKVILQIETYNDIYEKTYGNTIEIVLVHESGKKYKYTFNNTLNNPDIEINGLPEGLYSYKANAVLGGKNENVKGEFSIKSIDLEELETKADFNLLRQISSKNNGAFYSIDNFGLLEQSLLSNKPKGVIYSSESLTEVINLKWLLAVFILLSGFEWAMRKYSGSY